LPDQKQPKKPSPQSNSKSRSNPRRKANRPPQLAAYRLTMSKAITKFKPIQIDLWRLKSARPSLAISSPIVPN
jgi:hypothetical protein